MHVRRASSSKPKPAPAGDKPPATGARRCSPYQTYHRITTLYNALPASGKKDGGLAKLWEVVVGLAHRRCGRWRRWRRRRRAMEVWQKMVFPVRRVWTVVATRVRARKNGRGLLKLHDDVQTCGYQDVQVMWEILQHTEMEPSSQTAKQKGHFWRFFVRSQAGQPLPNSAQ